MGKILLVSFEGDEEELVNSVISVLDSGREKFLFQEIQLQSKIRHKGIAIDLKRREVVRDNRKIELTYTCLLYTSTGKGSGWKDYLCRTQDQMAV